MWVIDRRWWWVAAATVVTAAGWMALAYAAFGPSGVSDTGLLVQDLVALVPLGLGWLLVLRTSRSPVGPALAWLAATMVATPTAEAWGRTAASPAPWWGSGFMAVVEPGVWPLQLVGFMALLLVFPTGLLPGRRWRVVAALVPGSALLFTTATVVTLNYHEPPAPVTSPISVPEPVWLPMMLGALGLLLAVVLACGANMVVRYRRGGERTRQQLRWLILAAGDLAIYSGDRGGPRPAAGRGRGRSRRSGAADRRRHRRLHPGGTYPGAAREPRRRRLRCLIGSSETATNPPEAEPGHQQRGADQDADLRPL